jgi:CelD/BcsL family acetyltransferase involved in cellulose biosynthesis
MACEGVADYTGLLCRPEMEDEAVKALGRHLRDMGWRQLVLGSFRASRPRMEKLLDNFPDQFFEIEDFDAMFPDGTDHSIFPYVTLPGDWDTYLATHLGSETRRKVRRFMRQVEGSPEYRITVSDAGTFERDPDNLFRLWVLKWGSDHGRYVEAHRIMFRHCFEIGSLFMTVMWHGDRPLGVLANLLDDRKNVMLFKVLSRDETFGNPSPGFVLYAYAIRHAIEKGYGVCEFLQGNHAFKYSFGAKDRTAFQKRVNRRAVPHAGDVLDRALLPAALQSAMAQHRQGHLAEAERGYRQILHMDPQFKDAAAALAKLLADRKPNPGAS